MTFSQRIQAFDRLRDRLECLLSSIPQEGAEKKSDSHFYRLVEQQAAQNRWFTPFFIYRSIEAIVKMLQKSELQLFMEQYESLISNRKGKIETIFVISAGNIPIAAFHDFFSILISGNIFFGKLSSGDTLLLPEIAQMLVEIVPEFQNFIFFQEDSASLKNNKHPFDKVISTGSNNSARYFEYYFGKFPNILRKNRNSIAILTGNETEDDLKLLCDDIFLYFGLGCRSVSKIYIPKKYDFIPLIESMIKNSVYLCDHHHYLNNIEYYKTIYLMNQITFYDAGTMLLVENKEFSSPISVLHFEFYDDLATLSHDLIPVMDQIQCIAIQKDSLFSDMDTSLHASLTLFGNTQNPSLFEYPDQIDVIKFSLS